MKFTVNEAQERLRELDKEIAFLKVATGMERPGGAEAGTLRGMLVDYYVAPESLHEKLRDLLMDKVNEQAKIEKALSEANIYVY